MRLTAVVTTILVLSASPALAKQISLSDGQVTGVDMADGSVIYYGIPYAEAPEGALRWRPPVPRRAWDGVLDATRPAPACVQGDTGWNSSFLESAREDCLSLSIRTTHPRGGRRPVLVYIHGGANAYAGSGDLSQDAMHREGVVVVKVQYRLGIFGFLGLDALDAESPHGASGNYAMLDLLEALKWIRANIDRFGGDPDNITISGNSAGGLNALWLMLSHLADGLYHKVILQAVAPGTPRTAAQNAAMGDVLLDRLGLPSGAAGLSALRGLPADRIIEAARDLPVEAGTDPSFLYEQQIIDGHVMDLPYAQAFARGAGSGLPMIIGSNHQELGMHFGQDAVPALLRSAFGADAGRAAALYGVDDGRVPPDDPLLGSVATQIVTDMWFRCPVNWLAGQASANTARVWRYEFGLSAPGSGKPPKHTSEMDYVYRAVPAAAEARSWPPLQRYWANFMRSGDPNGVDLPAWPAFGNVANHLEITPEGLRSGTGWRGAVCNLMFEGRAFPRSAPVPATH